MAARATAARLLVVSASLALVAAETALRISGAFQIGYGWPPEIEGRAEPGSAAPARGGPRGPRLLLLGDSQVTNRGTEPPLLPARILEGTINRAIREESSCGVGGGPVAPVTVSVSTLGAGGWGQDQEYLALAERIGRLRPDLVLLWFSPENDLWNNAFPTHYPRNGAPKPTFVMDGGALVPADRRDVLPVWMELRLVALVTSALQRVSQGLRAGAIPRFPRLDQLLFDPDGSWDREILPPMPDRRPGPAASRSPDAALEGFNPYHAGDPLEIGKSHFAMGMDPGSPRVDGMVELTSRLVREIARLVESHGARFAAFYYSAEHTSQPLYPPDGAYTARGHPFVFSSAEMERRLSRILGEHLLLDVDLTIPRWRKPHDDPHLTTEANRFVMGRLADALLRRGWICGARPPRGPGRVPGGPAPAPDGHGTPHFE